LPDFHGWAKNGGDYLEGYARPRLSVSLRVLTAALIVGEGQSSICCGPNWRMSFEIPGRPRTSGLWYRPSERLTNTTPPAELFTLLDRLNDHDDLSATDALASVLRTWTVKSGSYLQERIPVLLENRIEILKQAAFVLASSPSDSFRLSNRETAPISAQQSRD
jgi:hypothetical protein